MHYAQLARLVQHRARLATPDMADRATSATLRALAERVPDTVAATLAERLPPDLAAHLREGLGATGPADPRLADDFVALVAERTSLDAPRAASVARTVFRIVDLESGGGLASRPRGVLPEDVRDLVARASRARSSR